MKTPRPLPSQLANMDEKHFDPRGRDPEKVAEAGKPNCYTITQGEKSSFHVTACLVTFAHGIFHVPPGVIHAAQYLDSSILENFDPSYYAKITENGSMEKGEVFRDWCQHFLDNLPPNQVYPVFLFLDGHKSRMTIEGLTLLAARLVFVIVFNSHSSSWTQMNDNGINAHLEWEYSREKEEGFLQFGYDCMTRAKFNRLFTRVWTRVSLSTAARMISIKAFEKVGIFPLNREKITKHSEILGIYQGRKIAFEKEELSKESLAYQAIKESLVASKQQSIELPEQKSKAKRAKVHNTKLGGIFNVGSTMELLKDMEAKKVAREADLLKKREENAVRRAEKKQRMAKQHAEKEQKRLEEIKRTEVLVRLSFCLDS